MSWHDDDAVTVTYKTLANSQKEAFELGEQAERAYWLDFVEKHIIHAEPDSCEKCDGFRFLATIIKLRHDL